MKENNNELLNYQDYNLEIITDYKSVSQNNFFDYGIKIITKQIDDSYNISVECENENFIIPDIVKKDESNFYIITFNKLTRISNLINIQDLTENEIIIKITNKNYVALSLVVTIQ